MNLYGRLTLLGLVISVRDETSNQLKEVVLILEISR